MKRLTRLLVAVLIPLAGCAPGGSVRPGAPPSEADVGSSTARPSTGPKSERPGYEGELSPAEQELREQSRKFDRTVWEGALLGVVAATASRTDVKVFPIPFGFVVVGRHAEPPAAEAAIGGSLGALAGMYLAEKQKRYVNAEDQLNAMIADVRTYNENVQALIAGAQTVLAEGRRRLQAMEASARQGQATEEERVKERARVLANRKVVDNAATGARDQREMFAAARRTFAESKPGTSTRILELELQAYRRNIDQLDAVAQAMARG